MTMDSLLPTVTRQRVQAGEVDLHAAVAGHDRGALAGHRLALDSPDAVTHLASVDVAHDGADRDQGRRIQAPVLLWGRPPGMELPFDPLAVWRRWAADVDGVPLPCGHLLAEERPGEVVDALRGFLA